MKKRKPLSVYLLLSLLFFLGLGGTYGGAALMMDPSGKIISLSNNYIHGGIFKNYLFPGMILFTFNGLFPLFICYALLKTPDWQWPGYLNIYKDQYWGWTFSLYAGFILLLWMSIQQFIIGSIGVIQNWYSLLGLAILTLTLAPAVKKYYSL